jgi:hypothetical protein
MPAKLSLYREKDSDIEFLLDSPNYARHKEAMCTVNHEISGSHLLINLIMIIISDGYFVIIVTYHFRC